MDAIDILRPVFVMGLLSVVMAIWLGATRIPALFRANIPPEEAWHTADLRDRLPREIVQVGDNYNHLFEQPTLFYATAIAIAVLGHVDSLHVQCAWAFTGIRIVHSLVQATINFVPARLGLFVCSWIALAIMVIREVVRSFA